jgi:hypothetical protein
LELLEQRSTAHDNYLRKFYFCNRFTSSVGSGASGKPFVIFSVNRKDMYSRTNLPYSPIKVTQNVIIRHAYTLYIQIGEADLLVIRRDVRVVRREQAQRPSAVDATAGRVDAPADMVGQRLRHDGQLLRVVVSEHVARQAQPAEVGEVALGARFVPPDEPFGAAHLEGTSTLRHI